MLQQRKQGKRSRRLFEIYSAL